MAASPICGSPAFLFLSPFTIHILKRNGVLDMGRGKGGYTEKLPSYKDSGGQKVTDRNTIFVAECYMDLGFEVVFRRRHDPERGCDLTIKTSNDEDIVKNIEVKGITSANPSKISSRIADAAGQIKEGDTIAIYLPKHRNNQAGRSFAETGIQEAQRKGLIKGPIEVWFADKTCLHY